MSLKVYSKFERLLAENNLKNKLTVEQSIALAEDVILSDTIPNRISEGMSKYYNESDCNKIFGLIKENFEDDFDEVDEMEDEDDIDESLLAMLLFESDEEDEEDEEEVDESKFYVTKDEKGKLFINDKKSVVCVDLDTKKKEDANMSQDEFKYFSKGAVTVVNAKSVDDVVGKYLGESSDDMYAEQITSLTGVRVVAIKDFAKKNGISLYDLMQEIGQGNIKPIDFSTALMGKDGNSFAKDILKNKNIYEGARPKKLTGAKKKSKEAKSQLMSILKKDPEVKGIMAKAKAKIIQKGKAIGKKNGIKVNRINFDKIKL